MKKIALITFEDNASNYEALSRLKRISNGNTLDIKQAAIIEKNGKGTAFSIKDSLDFESGNRVATGGLIGAIIGILGGPLGVLCGWVIGDLAGVGTNYVKAKKTTTIFDRVSENLMPNTSGLIVYMDEDDEELLDVLIANVLHGQIERFNYQEVKEDVDVANKHLGED
ncbi:hypothetical protein [Enterococcus sp. AZ072]|uniref:hypothetical protein n=1 Tax=unclassified Enterococcus TaxID=2608891 RepID=UPI003D2E7AE7